MRTFEYIAVALTAGLVLAARPALAFEGTAVGQDPSTTPQMAPQMPMSTPPLPAAPKALNKVAPSRSNALSALQYAAEDGHPIAQWKLGRMYARGDGVAQSDLRAFDYFSRIANAHAEDSPSAPQAAVAPVASACSTCPRIRSAAAALTTGPTVVPPSSGCPTTYSRVLAT